MFNITGYTITDTLHESTNSIIYRGVRTENNQAIILKTLRTNYPIPRQISRFNREYEFTKNLKIPGIRRALETIKIDNKPGLILEYVDGITLKEAFVEQPSSFPDFLRAAMQIARIVTDLHHHHIIHKDINPSNILIGPQHETVAIIDFGIATKFTLKTPHRGNPNQLEGTLPYMSPEQSGRMNRTVDFRTDLYSLGATLYACMVGRPPFEHNDPLALIHAHIAKPPIPPINLIEKDSPLFAFNHAVLSALSNVIMKLLSKKAEDRYQSASGVRRDLEQIAAMLENPKIVFHLGQDDVSEQLLMPETLYGREDDIDRLLETFRDLTGFENRSDRKNSVLTLVSGAAGVGKSALVSEIHIPMTEQHGTFIQGKFDQYQRNIPYSALTQALNQFCRALLTERDTTLAAWRDTILQAVGENGQVLIDIIPDLELVIGPQPPVPALGPQETHNRFAFYLQGFIQAISQAEHPLVMFLDDLQWADMASLHALKTLFQAPDLTHLLIIGAYRDNEVSAGDPLLITIDEIADSGISVSTIALQPLGQAHVAHWIADTLRHDAAIVQPLNDLVCEKTLGNPFFVRQFLQSLYEEGLLWCEHRTDEGQRNWLGGRPGWQWDLERIRQQAMTDNVVTLMVSNISKQPIALQTTLQIAACIGNRFDVRTLAWATEASPQVTYQQIVQGIEAGFLAPLDEQSTTVDSLAMIGKAEAQPKSVFRFVHDRIQQAAASMLSPAEQEQLHLSIGRLLLTHTSPDEQEEAIFSLVTHLNQGRRLITDAAERLRLIELNLLAGQRAGQATAYQAACEYLRIGMEMLPDTAWRTEYQLTYSLHTELIRYAYPTGQFDLIDTLVQAALQHTRTDLEYAAVQSIRIHALTAQAQHEAAIELGLQTLSRLGVTFPKHPTKLHILLAMLRTQYHLRGKNMQDLLEAPPLQDEKLTMVLNIMWRTGHSMILSNPELFALNMQKAMVLFLKHGYLGLAGLFFTGHAIIVAEVLRNYEQGVRLCELGLWITEQLHDPVSYAASHIVHYGMMGHWHASLFDFRPKLLETHRLCRAVGDTQLASMALFEYLLFGTYAGAPLAELAEQANTFDRQIASMNQEYLLTYLRSCAQFIQNLMGCAEEPHRLKGEIVDGEILWTHLDHIQDKAGLFFLHNWQAILGYHFGRYDLALRESLQAQRYKDANMAMMSVSVLTFYETLIRLELVPETSGKNRFSHQWAIHKNRKLLRKWANVSPVNYAHKYELVQAEWYRYRQNPGKAHACYQRAIALTREQGLQWDLALSFELAGCFYHEQEQAELARTCLRQAHQAYDAWGAAAKVRDLETRYPAITWREASGDTTTSTTSHALDWQSVIKAAQTLSGEINLEHLLTQLMRMVLENAGAEHGYLFLPQEQTWALEAEGHVDSETTVLQSAPLEKIERVSTAIIHYVARTQEHVVLCDAVNEGHFTQDVSILKHRPTSVLCAPLVNHGQVTGILYLENNVTTGAFTPDRLDVLNLLASQAAISIENARLYDQLGQYNKTLEARVAERTTELTTANAQLSREIAERERAEEELRHAKNAAEEAQRRAETAQRASEDANRAKSAFLANMSHELRTPLNAVLGYAQILLRSQTLSAEDRKHLTTISRSGEHLLALINDVLELSKIDANRMELQPVSFDLYQMLADLDAMFRLRAERKGLALSVEYTTDMPPAIRADQGKLRQILINLLGNAVKYTEEGEVELQVTKVTKVTKVEEDALKSKISNLKFSISDTGIGIAPADLEHVFNAFVQVGDQQYQKGTGLGLPISQRYVRMMGGDIHVDSEVGKGSTFSFTIPAELVDPSSLIPHHASIPGRVVGVEPGQIDYRLLIVEDEADNRTLLLNVLKPLGFDVREAQNGEEAVALWHTWQPHLIWMDMRMPVMDGYEATKRIRKLETRDAKFETRIIALTASAFEEDRAKVLEAGCDDFVRKPFREAEIFELLHKHLGVRFVYQKDEQPSIDNLQSSIDNALAPEALAALPAEWLASLEHGAKETNTALLLKVIEQIRPQNAAMAEVLADLTNDFEYDTILSLIQLRKGMEKL